MYFYFYVCVVLLYVYVPSSCQLALFGYPDRGFSVLFPQLKGKCQGITRKHGARPAPFQTFCVVLYIVCSVSFCVLFACKCVLYYGHRVATQLQLTNISYHIIYHIIYHITSWYLSLHCAVDSYYIIISYGTSPTYQTTWRHNPEGHSMTQQNLWNLLGTV